MSSRAPAIARGVVLQVAARGVALPLSLVTVAVATRYLGPQGYGVLTTAVVLVGLFEAFTELGVGAVVVRRVRARGESLEHLVGLSAGLSAAYAVPLALIATGVAALLHGDRPEVIAACAVLASGLVWRTLSSSLDPVFDVHVRYGAVAAADVLARAAGLGAALLVAAHDLGLVAMAAAVTAPHLVRAVLVTLGAVRQIRVRPRLVPGESWDLLRESLPLTLVLVVGVVYWNADGLLLTLLSDDTQVAAYGLALQIAFALAVVSVVFERAVLGSIAAAVHHDPARFAAGVDRAYRFLLLCAVPVAVLGALFGPRVATLVAGESFTTTAGPTLSVFFVAVACMFLTAVSGDVLVAAGDQRWLTAISVANLVGNVALNLVLIPRLGAVGAGCALVVSELVGLVLAHRRMRRRHGAPAFPFGALVRLVPAVAAGLAVAWAAWAWPVVLVGLASGVAVLLVARLTGALPRDLLTTLVAGLRPTGRGADPHPPPDPDPGGLPVSPSATDPALGVVIVHFRSEDTVVDTVADVRAVAPDDRIVLVDNSGTLDPDDFAVRVVAPEINGGYAGGVNRGVAELPDEVDTVLVVTHEVRVDPASVTAMTADLVPGVGQVGPVLVDAASPDGAIWSAGGHYSRFLAYPRHRLSVDDPAVVGWIDGAVFVSPRAAFDAVGGVPEHFFSYMEDIAYSRSLLAAGWAVTVSPAARAEQSGKGPSIRLAVRNRWLLLREFFPPVVATAGVAQLHLKARLLAVMPTAFHRDRAREYRAGLTDARRIHAERRAALQEAS